VCTNSKKFTTTALNGSADVELGGREAVDNAPLTFVGET